MQRAWQIVGPHKYAHLSAVKGLTDINDDGINDFACGSADVRASFTDPQSPTGAAVGAVFIVYSRPTGLEGDYLLDRLALPISDRNRVHGILLRGTDPNEQLGRVFDSANDFDGDGLGDVVVGSEGTNLNSGQAIVILGSSTIESPAGGWTAGSFFDPNSSGYRQGVRFRGAAQGDLAGANVAGVGDVDGDGYGDILVAAPGAEGGKGAVYLIYGAASLRGQDLSLAQVGTFALPGAKFIGRVTGDMLGGGVIRFPEDRPVVLNPDGDSVTARSRGVIGLGDIDHDGHRDFAISAMLANPGGTQDAGEVYIIYGTGDE